MTASKPVLRRRSGRMASGGTVTDVVEVDGVRVGFVFDHRDFTGTRFGARKWGAALQGVDDRAARWTAQGMPTRQRAVDALMAKWEEL